MMYFRRIGDNIRKKNIIILILSLSAINVWAQQLDNLKDQQPLLLGGYISTNQVIIQQQSDSTNNISYNGYFTGSLGFTLYGVNIPFSFIYSNQKGNFSHPFNQFGLHPSYKWLRAHIGYASMNFSPYTMNGHLFMGAGLEADPPGLLKLSAFYGKLNNAVTYDSANPRQIPSYQRMGYGLKLGIENEAGTADLSFFRAYDQTNSINLIPDSLQVLPEENLVLSLALSRNLFKNFILSGEFAGTMISTDIRAEKSNELASLTKPLGWFMTRRTTTITRKACKANITYNQTRFSLGAGYERVDPEYRTLGAYYFNNNFENFTFNFSLNLLKNKLNIGGNTGLQRDNLDNSKMNNNKRFAGSGTVSLQAGEKLNINASYSNFSSFTNVRSSFDYINQNSPYENWDTLNYRQVSQSISSSMSLQIKANEKYNQSLGMDITWQNSDDSQGDSLSTRSDFYNASTSYILSMIPYDFSASVSCSYNYSNSSEAESYTWGPNLNLSKQFLKKQLRTNLGLGYNTSVNNHIKSGETWNIRCGAGYTLKKSHSFNLNYLYQYRIVKSENSGNRKYTNQNLTFAYVYNFQIIKQKTSEKEKEDHP